MERKTVNIEVELHSRLRDYAKKSGLKMEVIATVAIRAYLDHLELVNGLGGILPQVGIDFPTPPE